MIMSNMINYASIRVMLLRLKSINFNTGKYYFGRFNTDDNISANFKFNNVKSIKFLKSKFLFLNNHKNNFTFTTNEYRSKIKLLKYFIIYDSFKSYSKKSSVKLLISTFKSKENILI